MDGTVEQRFRTRAACFLNALKGYAAADQARGRQRVFRPLRQHNEAAFTAGIEPIAPFYLPLLERDNTVPAIRLDRRAGSVRDSAAFIVRGWKAGTAEESPFSYAENCAAPCRAPRSSGRLIHQRAMSFRRVSRMNSEPMMKVMAATTTVYTRPI